MVEIRQTEEFRRWLTELRDPVARAKVLVRINRLSVDGHFGDVKPVGRGVLEMRIPHGPGYRVYLITMEERLVILLAGGTKSTQARDIERAIDRAKKL